MNKQIARVLSHLVCTILFVLPVQAIPDPVTTRNMEITAQDESMEWNFRVYLDESEIGYHRFSLKQVDNRQELKTEASFKVKFLFFTAYQYFHVNSETWMDNCLSRIESRTITNGKNLSVSGFRAPDKFHVESNGTPFDVSGCVKTFAYWNADVLNENTLLNSQTGELMPVTIESLPSETFTVLGKEINASKYRLQAEGVDLDLWYSEDRRWLGLESTVKGGRKLRYELI